MSSPLPVSGTSGHVVPPVPGVRLEQMLGQGGFATVYTREQVSLGCPIVVKIDFRSLHDECNRRRFMREMAAASRVSGRPNVVSLIDSGVLPDGRPCLVMERYSGSSLAQVLQRGGPSAIQVVSIVMAACSAPDVAHDAGALHHGIKPGNILIDAYGSSRLSDFGLATAQREGIGSSVILETMAPDFAPSEAFTLAAPSPRGDVWSIGAVLFALLIGRGPRHTVDGAPQSLSEIINHLSVPINTSDARTSEALRPLPDRVLHPDPAQWYRDDNELAGAPTRAGGFSYDALSTPHSALRDSHPLPVAISMPTAGSRRLNRTLMLLALEVTTGVVISAAVLGAVRLIDLVLSANRAARGASASPVLHAGARMERGAGSRPSATVRATALGSWKASPSPTAASTPVQVNVQGIPYPGGMP